MQWVEQIIFLWTNFMRHDLIIDFETFGKDAQKCAVIDCSVMVFSWDKFLSDKPYTMKDVNLAKRFKLNVNEQVTQYDFEIEKETLAFWQEQPSTVRSKITPSDEDLNVSEFTKTFLKFLDDGPEIKYWWSRSNTFDPIILGRLFSSQNKLQEMESHLKYWRVRDTRTYIDAKFDFQQKNGFTPIQDANAWEKYFKLHDSSWDILADVLRLQAIARAENDLEMV